MMSDSWFQLHNVQLLLVLLAASIRQLAACGGCSTCATTDRVCVPTQLRTKAVPYTTGWWWNKRRGYAVGYEYYLGSPYCCAGYKLDGNKCIIDARTCGGCDKNGVASQAACAQHVQQKRSRVATVSYYCHGWWFVSRICYKKATYYQMVRLTVTTCCSGYRLSGSMCIKDPSTKSCGVSKYDSPGVRTPHIVGGSSAKPNEFPWMLRLSAGPGKMCAGILIGRDWALTAAHCVTSYVTNPYLVSVVAGDHRYKTKDSTEQHRFVKGIFPHPDFSIQTFENDLALLKIAEPVDLSENVQPACLPDTCSLDYADQQVVVSGWGRASAGPKSSATVRYDELQYASFTVMSSSRCAAYTGGMENVLCVTDGADDLKKSPCFGDSGGALIMKDASGKHTTIGIGSFVNRAGCAKGSPSGFTGIGPYLRWINQLVF